MRVSRHTHQVLTELAARRGTAVSELLDRLAEAARRGDVLGQYNARMAELLDHAAERDAWGQEITNSEVSTGELNTVSDHGPVAR